MLSTTDIVSLTITIGVMLIGLTVILLSYANMAKRKYKSILGWIAFVEISLLIWAIFHVFLDAKLFPGDIVNLLHYWVAHSFVVIAAIGLIVAARLVSQLNNNK